MCLVFAIQLACPDVSTYGVTEPDVVLEDRSSLVYPSVVVVVLGNG